MICVCDDFMTFFNTVEGRTVCAYCKSHNIRQSTEKGELEVRQSKSKGMFWWILVMVRKGGILI